MTVELERQLMEKIFDHSSRTYPDECCGFLLGREGVGKRVSEVREGSNTQIDSRKNRFLIDPREFVKVERQVKTRGLLILGFYHSHPDAPASPSSYDREHAWPWYSYMIISVVRGKPEDVNSWVLEDDRSSFKREDITVL